MVPVSWTVVTSQASWYLPVTHKVWVRGGTRAPRHPHSIPQGIPKCSKMSIYGPYAKLQAHLSWLRTSMTLVAPPLLREFILWIKYSLPQLLLFYPLLFCHIYTYICIYMYIHTYIHVLEKPLLISPITPFPNRKYAKWDGAGGWGVWPRTRFLLRTQVSRSVNIDLMDNVEAIVEFWWQ